MGIQPITKDTLSKYQFIGNCNRQQGSKFSRNDFFEKLNYLKHLRGRVYTSGLSFYITSSYENNLFEKIHHLVNSNIFELDSEFNCRVFVLGLPQNLYSWFKNLPLITIQKQIINWLAANYVFLKGKDQIIEDQVYEPILFEVRKIVREYEKHLNNKILMDYGLQIELYKQISIKLTGAIPPEIFSDIEEITYYDGWGVNPNLNFDIILAYLTELDWKKTIIEESQDPLNRSESISLLLEKWKILYKRFEITKSNKYEKIQFKNKKDYLYIIREGETNRYKLGWTTNPKIEQKRLKQLQTGNSNKLCLVHYFEITSKETESVIHLKFKNSNIRGEWFELSMEQINNLSSHDWRLSQNII